MMKKTKVEQLYDSYFKYLKEGNIPQDDDVSLLVIELTGLREKY